VLKNVVLGGIKNGKNVPEASFNPKKSTEVQLISNIPTQISLNSLPARQNVRISALSSGGKRVALGSATTTKSGQLLLPPFTITNPKTKVTISIQVVNKKYTFVVRATS
jgi:hypothetical protein